MTPLPPMPIAMTTEGLYWLFSTIAQTLGAIVALVGMLAIYRLQGARTVRTELAKDAQRILREKFGTYKVESNVDILANECIKVAESYTEPTIYTKAITNIGTEIKKAGAHRNEIIQLFKIFLFIHLVTILASLILLPYCSELLPYLPKVIVLTVTALLIAFCSTAKLCILIVK